MQRQFLAAIIRGCMILSMATPVAAQPAVDQYGDVLPDGAVQRFGSSRFRHGRDLFALAFSHDGRQIASAAERSLRIWDASSGQELAVVPQPDSAAYSIAYSHSGKWIVAGLKDGSVWLRDSRGALMRQLSQGGRAVMSVAFSLDDTVVMAGMNDGYVRFWNAGSGAAVGELQVGASGVNGLALSRDGKWLATGNTGGEVNLYAWQPGEGRLPERIARLHHESPAYAVAFTPDGAYLASASRYGKIFINDVKKHELFQTLQGHSGPVLSLAFSPDGKVLASGGRDKTLRFWDWRAAANTKTATGHTGMVHSVAWSPDGSRLATAGRSMSFDYDRSIRIWNAAGDEVSPDGSPDYPAESVAVAPDGRRMASACIDGSATVWATESGRKLASFQYDNGTAFGHVAFSPDGKTLAVTGRAAVFLRDAETGNALAQIDDMGNHLRSVAFSPDGRWLVTGDMEGNVNVANVATRQQVKNLAAERLGEVWSVVFTPDSKRVAAASWAPGVYVWDVATGEVQAQFKDHEQYVRSVAISPDGRLLAAGGDDDVVAIRELVTGELVCKLHSPGGAPCLAFAADSRTVVAGTYLNELYFWDLAVPQADRFLTYSGRYGGRITQLAMPADGSAVYSSTSDGTIVAWDLAAVTASRRQLLKSLWTQDQLDAFVTELGADAATAQLAVWSLIGAGSQAVEVLDRYFYPPEASGSELDEVPGLIKQLDADQFATRERANRRLEKIGVSAETLVKTALDAHPPIEVQLRLQRLLATWGESRAGQIESTTARRQVRAIYVLEQIETPAARGLLEQFARGDESSIVTTLAKQALERCERQ